MQNGKRFYRIQALLEYAFNARISNELKPDCSAPIRALHATTKIRLRREVINYISRIVSWDIGRALADPHAPTDCDGHSHRARTTLEDDSSSQDSATTVLMKQSRDNTNLPLGGVTSASRRPVITTAKARRSYPLIAHPRSADPTTKRARPRDSLPRLIASRLSRLKGHLSSRIIPAVLITGDVTACSRHLGVKYSVQSRKQCSC